MGSILIVDDDPSVLSSLRRFLEKEGHEVATAKSGTEALRAVAAQRPDLIFSDLRMEGLSGMETLTRLKIVAPRVPVVLMTAFGTTESAIEAMKHGAFDYFLKPFDLARLRELIAKGLSAARSDDWSGGEERPNGGDTGVLLGGSPRMLELFKSIGQVAASDVTVLIEGESGTGKELVARAIHRHGRRAHKPFVPVNCAAIPETLLESELFGYEKGSFTGAEARRIGRFEQAHHATLFLDEIGDMSTHTQAKILRVLQEQSFERVGGREPIQVDVRILAATNRRLADLAAAGKFRRDLFYRLDVVSITVPPLREHNEDIPELAAYFLARSARTLGNPDRLRLSAEALRALMAHDWPGNIRELRHCVERAAVLCNETKILAEHVRLAGGEAGHSGGSGDEDLLRTALWPQLRGSAGSVYESAVARVERIVIVEAMSRCGGNLTRAASLLGISRPTLRAKARQYGVPLRPAPLDEPA